MSEYPRAARPTDGRRPAAGICSQQRTSLTCPSIPGQLVQQTAAARLQVSAASSALHISHMSEYPAMQLFQQTAAKPGIPVRNCVILTGPLWT